MTSPHDPPLRLLPTGTCWCGCEKPTGLGKFFVPGHDKAAEAALMALKWNASVPEFLHAHGYGPQRSVSRAAVDAGVWEECPDCTTVPGYRGAPRSIATHQRKYH